MQKGIYKTLFFSTFKISACTFGGGFVIVPLLKKRFVEELGFIEEKEMLDLTAIAQSTPGPIAVNASYLVGYHIAGIKGALVNALASVLPPLIIISIISVFYQQFRNNVIVNFAMAGMLAGVAAVLCDVVLSMLSDLYKQKNCLAFIVFLFSFIAVRFWNWNIILIIFIAGIIGAINMSIKKNEKEY